MNFRKNGFTRAADGMAAWGKSKGPGAKWAQKTGPGQKWAMKKGVGKMKVKDVWWI